MSIELTWWIEHQKSTTVGLATLDRKATTYYLGLVIEVCLRHWSPITDEDTPIDFPKP
jgi:hypothetical protein